jgi:pilus assembly protein FimV
VDEPVVTVYLRSGCDHKVTRRFVLLSEMPSETVVIVNGAPDPVKAPRNAGRPAANLITENGLQSALAPASDAALVKQGNRAPVQNIRRPHLKLSSRNLTEERTPSMAFSTQLPVVELADDKKRDEAALLWRSLNTTFPDIVDAERRRQLMETDLKGLQLAISKNRMALQELSDRLENAETQRYTNPLVYGLAFASVLFGLGLAYLLLKMRDVGIKPWWRYEGLSAEADQVRVAKKTHGAEAAGVKAILKKGGGIESVKPSGDNFNEVAAPRGAEDRHLMEKPAAVAHAGFTVVAPGEHQPGADTSIAPVSGHVDFTHSLTSTLRALSTQEMLDVRQQAEFFMTLGQHDEAIGLLKNSADGSVEANPLVYLDLLRVLHTLGRKTEYDHYRTDFNALFSGRVPPYADFNQSGEGLEGYPEVCHMVESLWPSAEAIDYIEKNLVRNMGEGSEGGFDLEAFRDLLMLHGMAKRIDLISESGFMPFSAAKVNSPDVTAASSYSLPDISPEAEIIAPVSGQVDAVSVDLDLSEHHGNLINFDAVDLMLPPESNASKS